MNAAIRDSKELRCGGIVIAADAPEKCALCGGGGGGSEITLAQPASLPILRARDVLVADVIESTSPCEVI